jgi:hypothetical protein
MLIVISKLNLGISPTTCKPGDNVQLTIATTVNSTVSLLAIDQRVLLLKTGNDLSLNEIYDNFDQYNTNSLGIFDGPFMARRRPFFPWIWYDTYEMKFDVRNSSVVFNMFYSKTL